MKHELSLLTSFLNELMREEHNLSNIKDIDINEIYLSSSTHGLNSILYPVVEHYYSIDDTCSQQIKKWTVETQKSVFLNIIYTQQVGYIYNLLIQNGLTPIIIKGLAISRFYKAPQYRRMGDLDILIRDCEWDKAIETFIQLGYEKVDSDNHPMHREFVKKNSVMIELHRQLIHTGYLGKRDDSPWYEHIWNNNIKISLDGIEFYAMCSEDELINQITHFASHFVYYGTKISHIFEIALIINSSKKELNWDYIENILNQMGFLLFSKLLFSVCKTFFFVEIPKNLTDVNSKTQEKFISDLFEYFSVEKNKGDFRGWTNILSNYRCILRYNLLKPIIPFIELKSQYKIHGLRLLFILKNMHRNTKMIKKKIRIVKNFRIINWCE